MRPPRLASFAVDGHRRLALEFAAAGLALQDAGREIHLGAGGPLGVLPFAGQTQLPLLRVDAQDLDGRRRRSCVAGPTLALTRPL